MQQSTKKSIVLMALAAIFIFLGSDVRTISAAPGDLTINEISADPDASNGDANGDGIVSTTDDEFIEIVNTSGGSLDISGWTLSDGFSVRHVFPTGSVVADGCAIIVFGGGTPTGAFGGSLAQTASTGSLGFNNGGDTATISDGVGTVDSVGYGGEGGNNQSLTRDPDITGALPLVEHTTATGSGGALFSPGTNIDGSAFSGCVAPPPGIVINEIMQNPSIVSDGSGEWFELYNPEASPVDIDGWTVADNDSDSFVINNGGPLEIPAGGYLVLGNNSNSGTNGGVTVAYQYSSYFLANGADEVVISDGSGVEVDRVEYDGGPVFPDPNGASMALFDPALDNNDGANWCESPTPFGAGDKGTPGAANDCPTPPTVVINEINADPDSTLGDANGDGVAHFGDDEFVELVNVSGAPLDMSGWTLTDGAALRHIFPAGSIVGADCTVVVFGGGTPTGSFGGSLVQTASSGALGLNNGGDTVTINTGAFDAAVTSYGGEGGANQSLTRDPDITGPDPLVQHTTATGSGGALFSPGTLVDGSLFAGCTPPTSNAVINEFVANHVSSDTEAFLEVFGSPSTDYSSLTLLEIEGDSSSNEGQIDAVLPLGSTDANGYWLDDEDMENGTITILLVENFTGSSGSDIDSDDDGVIDNAPWDSIVDAVAVSDGGGSDLTYAATVLAPGYDGIGFTPGGASRIPNGTDTNTTADWIRNDFDGYGFAGFPGSPALGEAVNTPGADNQVISVLTDPDGVCYDPATLVHTIQGSGSASTDVGNIREVEGIVVGDFDGANQLGGFFLQEEDSDADVDTTTSEGIFVFKGSFGPDVMVGDRVRVRGSVTEFFGLTELNNLAQLDICDSGNALPTVSTLSLPLTSMDDFEYLEGMYVNLPQTLYVTENFTTARYGEVELSAGGRLYNPTHVALPGAPALAVEAQNDLSRIQLDDGSTVENPLPLPPYLHPNNTLRGGDTTSNVYGVLSYAFGTYEVHPTAPVTFTETNLRQAAPTNVGGSLKVASFNVLNYFTTIDNAGSICGPLANQGCRGADTAAEFTRQRDKIIAAIVAMDADIVGLMELENHPTDDALKDLVAGLNAAAGAGTYSYISTGTIGSDAIKVALIYKPASVTPSGSYAILDSSYNPNFIDTKNRPVLAQTFAENANGSLVTVAVNHFKSKGSNCNDVGDPDIGDGQGNCNLTRTKAAQVLVNWLATDPTGSGSMDTLIIGDLNAYRLEDPIAAIEGAGFTELIKSFLGASAYSYVFQGEAGYLDHALASASLTPLVTGVTEWHINADEPPGLDYNNYNQPGLYSPNQYRASDHDPVIVGLCLLPSLEVSVDPSLLWPPNHKYVTVNASFNASSDVTSIVLVDVVSNEPDSGINEEDLPDDIVIIDNTTFDLRAERDDEGTGRVYTITYEATNGCGSSVLATATVTVPHDSPFNSGRKP